MTFKILLLLKLDSIKVYQKEKLLMCQNQVTEKRVNRKKTTVTHQKRLELPMSTRYGQAITHSTLSLTHGDNESFLKFQSHTCHGSLCIRTINSFVLLWDDGYICVASVIGLRGSSIKWGITDLTNKLNPDKCLWAPTWRTWKVDQQSWFMSRVFSLKKRCPLPVSLSFPNGRWNAQTTDN